MTRRPAGKLGVLAGAVLTTTSLVTLAVPGSALAAEPSLATEACASGSTCGSGAPSVYPGLNNQPASSLTVQFTNANFAAGDTITLPIEPGGAAQTGSSTSTAITYASATVTVSGPTAACGAPTAGSGSDTNPGLTASLTTDPADSSAMKSAAISDEIVLTFGAGATGTASDCWTVDITNIAYDVGSSVGPEVVDVAADYNSGSTTTALAGSPVENAQVPNSAVNESTAVGVAEGSTGNSLPSFLLKETAPGQVPATSGGALSYLQASAGGFTGTATVTVTGFTVATLTSGNACPASGTSSASVTAPTSGTYAGEYPFCLYGPTTSSTGPGSVTVSSITYRAPATPGPQTFTLTVGSSSYSTSGQPPVTVVYNPRLAGYSADDTAAAAAESTYAGGPIGGSSCSGSGGAVLLASDAEYQDALSASFLGYADLPSQVVGTTSTTNSHNCANNPVLLNPPTPPPGGELNTAAVAAIAKLGASTVYIVGGTDAISADVATQLGQIQIGTLSSGQPQYLQVVRIAGYTAEETAAMVAQTPTTADGGTAIGTVDQLPATPGAYGAYDSGASESSSGPTSAVSTAILADADEFQDALAASPLAYNRTLPVLLTSTSTLDPNTQTAITDMGIKQVIVVGGSAAVSDTVVSQLQGMGVSVLRIAGTTFDATSAELAGFELNDYTKGTITSPGTVEGLGSAADCDATICPGTTITVGTSRGDSYQDALASSQVLGWSGKTGSAGKVEPLLLNTDTSTAGPAVVAFLGSDGTGPNGGLVVYTNGTGTSATEHVLGDDVFGGTLAQTSSLVQSELDDIAAG
jgi:hypothetical protein